MKYTSYPKYKDADVEWMDTQPMHWAGGSLRWFADIFAGGTPSKINEDFWNNGTVPWLNSGSVNQQLITQPSAYITTDALANSSAKWIPADSLVIALAGQGKTKGMAAQLGIDTTCNQSMAAIVPNSNLEPRFLYWWLRSNYQNVRNMAGGDLRDGLNLEMIGSIQCPVPNKYEQTQIAAFLDRETAKIDRLIEKQQRLIKLLEEKRQAAISHAITKGLNPHVPMKESGVEWLGEVPTHWQLKKLKHIKSPNPNSFVDGPFGSNLKSEHFIDNGDVYVIESNFATQNKLSTQKLKTISLEHFNTISRSSCQGGDIIIAKIGAQYGKSSILPVLDKPAVVSGNSLKLTVNSSLINVEYLKHVLQHLKHEGAMDDIVNSTAQPALTLGGMNNISIPLPMLDEQEAIIHYINTESKRLNRAINSSKKLIELSRERRTALISAAVTGKIDVRDQIPQDVEEAIAS